MHWIIQLGLAVVLIALAALTGAKPEEGKPVGRTRLMTAARVVLALTGVAILVYLGLKVLGTA